jgi:hypothetical protein
VWRGPVDEGLRPDHVLQPNVGAIPISLRACLPDCSMRHLQIGDAGKHLVAGDNMIGEEELAAAERGNESALCQVRHVPVQQRMQSGSATTAPVTRTQRRNIDPVTLLRERIRRQMNAPWLLACMQRIPVDACAARP